MVNGLQVAIYQRLTQAPISLPAIYDEPPQDVTGLFTVIGDDTMTDWDDDHFDGFEATVTIYTYHTNTGQSQTVTGYKDLKIRMGAIYDALHHYALTVIGYNALQCIQEFSEVRRSQDGTSRQGIQRFRILLHK